MHVETRRFGPVLVELVIKHGFVRKNHSPDWVRLVTLLPEVSYETLRKAIAEERPPSEVLMRRVALALSVEPTVFVEYCLLQARRELDPGEVGWSRAVEALRAWEASRTSLDRPPA